MKNRKGSLILESALSIFLLLVCISLSVNIVIYQMKILKKEKIYETMSMALISVESEIKNNVTFKELNNIFEYKKIVEINYDDLFLEDLLKNDLFDLEKKVSENHCLKISLIYKDDDEIKINTMIKYEDYVLEEDMIKTRWMDEI